MYKAAKKMPYYDSQRDALIKVVHVAINIKDFNMAVIAAKDIPYHESQRDALLEVVRAAVKDRQYYGYALAAAEAIPYYDSQRDAYQLIVNAYEKKALKTTNSDQSSNSVSENSTASSVEQNNKIEPCNNADSADAKKRAAD